MTVLSAVQRFASVVGIEIPEMVFGPTDRTSVEIRHLIDEVAEDITKHHDWRALSRQLTIPANASSIDLPADFDRWRIDTAMETATGRVFDRIDGNVPDYFPLGGWRVVGGSVIVHSGPGEALSGTYQHRHAVKAIDGGEKPSFDTDSDEFVLPERLLTLGMIWRWKSSKALPYGQDFDQYEQALGKAVAYEGPRTIISTARRGVFSKAKLAWPGVVGTPGNV